MRARIDRLGPPAAPPVVDTPRLVAGLGEAARWVGESVAYWADMLEKWATRGSVDVIITTGGTGFSPRDVTPEATLSVVDRRAPGISEAVRAYGVAKGVATASLSRAEAGLIGPTLVINLPGSLKAVQDGMEVLLPLLPHALEMIAGKGHGTP